MLWDGRTVNIQWNYVPDTQESIKWHQVANGDHRGSDRTPSEDVYFARIVFRGLHSELMDLTTTLANNRNDFNVFCGEGEEIFGADLDYSMAIPVTMIKVGFIRKKSFKVFDVMVTLRHLNPSFLSTIPDFTKLRLASHQNTSGSEYDITKHFTYDSVGFSADHATDPGLFKGQFTQTRCEMAAIRRYLLITARANAIVFPTFGGITEPFGPRMGTGPFYCKIIKWRDTGRENLTDWGLSITFARDFSAKFQIQETGSAPDQIQETGSAVDQIQEVLTQ